MELIRWFRDIGLADVPRVGELEGCGDARRVRYGFKPTLLGFRPILRKRIGSKESDARGHEGGATARTGSPCSNGPRPW